MKQTGFSTAELLITIFIGMIFLLAGYQLFVRVVSQSRFNYDHEIVSSAARAHVRRAATNASLYPGTCSSTPATFTEVYAYGPFDAITFTFTFTCPQPTALPDLRKIDVVATNHGVTASHAGYYKQP